MTGKEFQNSLAKGKQIFSNNFSAFLLKQIRTSDSDLRIQVQTDPRYQSFGLSATMKEILGYEMKVASLDDVLQ
jgi:hypothetical protein